MHLNHCTVKFDNTAFEVEFPCDTTRTQEKLTGNMSRVIISRVLCKNKPKSVQNLKFKSLNKKQVTKEIERDNETK